MKKMSGFTLLEVMVVVVIMGMLASVVTMNVMDSKAQAEVQKAKIDTESLQQALDMYKLDNGTYPTTDQGLEALVSMPSASPAPKNYKKGGYIQKLPDDPWGNQYQYLNPGIHNSERYDIYSKGPDGEDDTDDDIGNWK